MATTPAALPAPAGTPDPSSGLPPERGTPPGTPSSQTRPTAWSRLKKSILPILGITAAILAVAAAVYYGPTLWNRYKSKFVPTTVGTTDVPALTVETPTNATPRLPITFGNIAGTNSINVNTGSGNQYVMNGATIIGSRDFTTETTNHYAERRGPAPAVDALPGITLPERKVIGPTQEQVTLLPGEFATIVRTREKPGFQLQLESPLGLTDWCRNHGELPTGTLVQNVAHCPVTFRVNRF